MKFIDTNAWCGSWPFAPLSLKKPDKIGRRSLDIDIIEAHISSFDTLFQSDPMPGNRAMLKALRNRTELRPLPVINPGTTAWEDHLEEMAAYPKVVGIRLTPAYHGYRLNSVAVRRLIDRAKVKGLRLVVTARLVDERHEHQAVSIKPVGISQLATFIERFPKTNPLIQGLGTHVLRELSSVEGLFSTDTSFAEWKDTFKVIKKQLPVSRILYGSLAPLQVMQAQIDKVRMSSLTTRQRESIANGNARNYFKL